MIVHVLWERLQDQVPQAMIFWGENPQERKRESSVEHGDSCHTTMSSPKWRRWGRSDAVNLLDSWQTKEGFSRLSVSSWAKVSHMRYCMPPRNRLAFLCLPDSSIRLVPSVGNTGPTQSAFPYTPAGWKPAKYMLMVAISTAFSRKDSSALLSYETISQRKKNGQRDGRNSVAWWITRTTFHSINGNIDFCMGTSILSVTITPFPMWVIRRGFQN